MDVYYATAISLAGIYPAYVLKHVWNNLDTKLFNT